MSTHEDDIRAAFIRLRNLTDPRGHDLLDALEDLTVGYDQGFDDIQRLVNAPPERFSVRADLLEPQPKDDDYHALVSDLADYDRKRRRENA